MPLFARRHYDAIAAALRGSVDLYMSAERDELIDRLIQLFERDNPAFDGKRFRRAVYRDGSE